MSHCSNFLDVIRVTVACWCLLTSVANCSVDAASNRPNLILIMADDFGFECVTANGGESYHTPNLDQLAATGMRFEQCYVQPLCTPTRVQLMTGLYNVRNYIEFGLLDPEAVTFAHLLKQAGYATGIAGKWQLGRDPNLPRHFGFDESYLWQHTRRPPRYANPGLEHNAQEHDFHNGEYGPTLVNDFALDFLSRHQSHSFFLYYPMLLTHDPYQPTPDSPDWDPKAEGEQVHRDVKHFAEMTEYMDKMVGRIVAKLDELGLRENTLVLFLGDNGTGRQVTSQLQGKAYPGGKGSGTIRGMHVPLIANWPGKISAGQVNHNLISSTDFLPTLCEAAGAKLPDHQPIDGISFFPQLLGKSDNFREILYCWYSRNGGPNASVEFAMTTDYKLYQNGPCFHLKTDPFESQPLSIEQLQKVDSETAKRLQAELQRFAEARPEKLRKPANKTKVRD